MMKSLSLVGVALFAFGAGGLIGSSIEFLLQPKTETEWAAELAREVDGVTEYALPDGRRVDILTDQVAWEVEWCATWEESIGQAIGYAVATDRRPGVWLLKRGRDDDEEYNQCLSVVAWLRGRGIAIEFHMKEVGHAQ